MTTHHEFYLCEKMFMEAPFFLKMIYMWVNLNPYNRNNFMFQNNFQGLCCYLYSDTPENSDTSLNICLNHFVSTESNYHQ